MKALIALAALVGSCSFAFHGVATAHGGTYRGPADSTAPASSGSGGTSSGGSTSSSGGQSSQPGAPSSSGGSSSGSSSGSSAPSGPPMSSGSGATWEPWWAFNRDPFLNLKAIIHEGDPTLGSDSYFLGHVPLAMVRDQLKPTEGVIHDGIVPALLRVLEKETDNDLVTGALIALAKIGDRPGMPAGDDSLVLRFRKFLQSSNQEIAETAAVSLGILANDSSIEPLVDLLRDTKRGRELVGQTEVPWRTRAFAAYGLGLTGYYSDDLAIRARILSVLRGQLEGDALSMATPDVGVACLTAMSLVWLDVDSSCLLLAGRCPDASHCRRGQLEWLLDYAANPKLNYVMHAHIPTTLARLTQYTAGEPQLEGMVVVELLGWARGAAKVQRHLRASAIMALGALGTGADRQIDREIINALEEIVGNSRQPEVRTLALVSLGQVGARKPSRGNVQAEAVAKVREFLLEQFADGRSTDRGWSALALSLLESRARQAGIPPSVASARVLRKALAEATSPDQVGAYAIALGVMQDVDSEELMLKKLEQLSDDRSRGHICIGLGLMNSRESIEALRKLLKGSRYRPALLREAAISLGLLGDKNVVDDLVDEMQRSTSLTGQSAIAAALGSIGDARSVAPLLKMLEDPEFNVRARAFAAVALGIVADKEALPWNSKIAVGANYLAGTPTLTDGLGAGILDIL